LTIPDSIKHSNNTSSGKNFFLIILNKTGAFYDAENNAIKSHFDVMKDLNTEFCYEVFRF